MQPGNKGNWCLPTIILLLNSIHSLPEGGGEKIAFLFRLLQHLVLHSQHPPTGPHLLPQLSTVLLGGMDLGGGRRGQGGGTEQRREEGKGRGRKRQEGLVAFMEENNFNLVYRLQMK